MGLRIEECLLKYGVSAIKVIHATMARISKAPTKMCFGAFKVGMFFPCAL